MSEYNHTPGGDREKDAIRERYGRQRDMSKVTFIPAKKEIRPYDPTVRKRVVVYCRVSTDGIAQVSSFELQKNYYLKYVRQRPDWKLVALYSDEGITATSMDKRIGLLTMLDDARAGKFDMIIVKNLSRLNRNLKDCLSIVNELRKLPHPVGILFETENMYTLDKNVDFTLTVLSLVAEEESHKKSEAMNASYFMRFSQGDYMKPSLLGYRRIGVNEIEVDPEEAKTVRLIFDMFRAGYDPKVIASVLMCLGRKTHTRITKNGKVIGGGTKWTAGSVKDIIENERRAGDVLAQKTYTPDFKDHKSVPNNGALPQFYARDQHEAIVPRVEFLQAVRILDANRGGWKHGLQQMEVFESGALKGFIGTSPNWRGFDTEDYNRAGLRAYGMSDAELQAIEDRIHEQIEAEEKKVTASAMGFQHRYAIDSDNYELFPDVDENTDDVPENKVPQEDFATWIDRSNEEVSRRCINKYSFSKFDFTRCELIRPEFFSTREKAHVTFDRRGLYFNKVCNSKLSGEDIVEDVDIYYNPTERLVIVKRANGKTAKSLHWVRHKDDSFDMKRCSSVGLSKAIYANMGWENSFKYRVLGSLIEVDGEEIIAFPLDDCFSIVPAKQDSVLSIDTSKLSEQEAKVLMRDGTIPSNETVPDLDDFKLGDGPMSKTAKIMARSRAIYFDEITDKVSGSIEIKDMGDRKFDPKCIQSLIQRGITPKEGWFYLKGMAVISKGSFTIFPKEWADCCGNQFYDSSWYRLKNRFQNCKEIISGIPYGWTVGLNVPSPRQIREEIATLQAEMVAS